MRFLLVADDLSLREKLVRVLESDGHQVDRFHRAQQILQMNEWAGVVGMIVDDTLLEGYQSQFGVWWRRHRRKVVLLVLLDPKRTESTLPLSTIDGADYLLKPISLALFRAGLNRLRRSGRMLAHLNRLSRYFLSDRTELGLIQRSISAGVAVVDSKFRFLEINPLLALWGNGTADRCLGRSLSDVFPEWAPQLEADCHTVFEGGMPLIGRGLELSPSAKLVADRLNWLVDYYPLKSLRGTVTAVGFVVRDMTEVNDSQERLLQTERLAAIGEAMAGLAHESRNALQRSQACLEMLSRRVQDRADAAELIVRIQQAQDDLHRLYEEVREYAAPIKLQSQPWRLDEIVEEAWDNLAYMREPGRTIEFTQFVDKTGDFDLTCNVNRFAIRRAVRNILENSLAACGREARITVGYRLRQRHGREGIEIVFEDNGPGMTEEQRQKIFDPFFTTKLQGTGLGMPIAKRLIEAHGGEISVGLSDRPGTTIVIFLTKSAPTPG